jgi:UDP-N-acetylglucosamine--N-acetylmuramyl-(pentapeptide) pyrophosphoryl-undecaprenol N-acetylglucosamine transferase
LKLPPNRPVLLITGGSQGAALINRAVGQIAKQLAAEASVVHLAGERHLKRMMGAALPAKDYRLIGFAGAEIADYLAAADLVVARAGASTLADVAYFAKPAILIPNPQLVGGHQLANAAAYAQAGAAVVLDEKTVSQHPGRLLATVRRLLGDSGELRRLSGAVAALARPRAAKDIAGHILAVGRGE